VITIHKDNYRNVSSDHVGTVTTVAPSRLARSSCIDSSPEKYCWDVLRRVSKTRLSGGGAIKAAPQGGTRGILGSRIGRSACWSRPVGDMRKACNFIQAQGVIIII
jgi:hypothetical protein